MVYSDGHTPHTNSQYKSGMNNGTSYPHQNIYLIKTPDAMLLYACIINVWCLCHFKLDSSYIMECPIQPPLRNIESERASKIIWRNTEWKFKINKEMTTEQTVSNDPIPALTDPSNTNMDQVQAPTPTPTETSTQYELPMGKSTAGIDPLISSSATTSVDEMEGNNIESITKTTQSGVPSTMDHEMQPTVNDTSPMAQISENEEETEVTSRGPTQISDEIQRSTDVTTTSENHRKRRSSGTCYLLVAHMR